MTTVAPPAPVPATETAVKKPAWESFPGLRRLPGLRKEFELYLFQQYAIYKAILEQVFIIALSTGLGKTVCAYATFFYYKMKFPKTRLLVVTNKSAVLQFRHELDKFFTHDLRAVAIHSNMKFGGKTYQQSRKNAYDAWYNTVTESYVDVLVMNYATFRKDGAHIVGAIRALKAQGYHVFVVFDEATVFKNISTQTHKVVATVAAECQRVLGLTATLTKGKLEEIYGIFKAMGVNLASSKQAFEDEYCIVFQHPKMKHFKTITGYKNTVKFVTSIAKISIVLRKIDVAKFLPAYTLKKVEVEHDPEQYKLISDIYSGSIDIRNYGKEDLIEELPAHDVAEDQKEAVEAEYDNNMLMTTGFTENGFIKRALQDIRLVTKQNLHDFKTMSPKTAELMRLLQDEFTGEKIVVYTPSKIYLKLLRDTIKNDPNTPDLYKRVLEIHGEISQIDREKNKELFQTDKQHNIILINDAGLESINLQAASVLIVMTMPSSGGNMVQLAGRLSRLGSTNSNLLLLYLLTEGSQDEDEYLIINQQMQLMAQIMGEAEKGLIDWDYLREAEAVRSKDADLDEEEFKTMSTQKLLLYKRKKRASSYGKNVTLLAAQDDD